MSTEPDSTRELEAEHEGQIRTIERVVGHSIIIAAVALTTGLILRHNHKHIVNDGSRWNTVWNLVHNNTYRTDRDPWTPLDHPNPDFARHYEGPWWTIDMVAWPMPDESPRPNGTPPYAYYSAKHPLLPTMVAGLYYVVWRVGDALDGPKQDLWRIAYPVEERTIHNQAEQGNLAGRTLLILINIVPLFVFLHLYRRLLERSTYATTTKLLCLATGAFGTFLTAYSRTFNNHILAGFCAFVAVYCALRIYYGGGRSWFLFSAAGFFAALAMAFELPALALLAGILAFLFYKAPIETAMFSLPAAVIPIGAYFLTNYMALGFLRPAQVWQNTSHQEMRVLYHFQGSYWNNLDPEGIDGQNEPKGIYFTHMLVGHHGIFSLTPIFLLAFFGIGRHLTAKPQSLPLFHGLVLLITVVVVVFYVFKTNNYGGGCQGLRWTFWMIPLWLVALPHGVDVCMRNRAGITLALVLFALSAFTVSHALVGRYGPWGNSWLHWALREWDIISY